MVVREIRADAAVEVRDVVPGGGAGLLEDDAGVLQIVELDLERGLGAIQRGTQFLKSRFAGRSVILRETIASSVAFQWT